MKTTDLRYRQIHMDFHTTEAIEGIGSKFDAEFFASTLDKARVDSITCFARGHHGWLYYDSKEFPERIHPHLTNKNLLKEQIEACHKRDIRVPIYITVQIDFYSATRHPEWLAVAEDGSWHGQGPYEPGFGRCLCVNSPYRDFLKAHTNEVLKALPTDGLFFDIVSPVDCSCQYCLAGMKKEGLEPSDKANRMKYAVKMLHAWEQEMTDFIRQTHPDCTIFYNSGHVGPRLKEITNAYTHFELESLPSGGWGYMHFPLSVRYARNLDVDCLGMTGKFLTTWGDFHSFKNQAALEFECFTMLALNAKCSIGDQLLPHGKICEVTYNLIGAVYSQVEKKQPYCQGVKALTDIAVFTPEEFQVAGGHANLPEAAMGITRMLQEGSYQFEIVDSQADISSYKVVILPDSIPVSAAFAKKLEKFVASGGSLIASNESGLNVGKDAFALDCLGVKLKGQAPFNPDFILPQGEMAKGLPQTEHVMYLRAMEVEAQKDAQVLCDTIVPYFNRNYKHFCSHQHSPSSGKAGYPAIVKNGRAIYFAHPVFTQYNAASPFWCKKLVLNALNILLAEPLVKHDGPSTVITALNDQAQQNRMVLHMLHYIPERRCEFDIIEDVIPIFDIKTSIRADRNVKKVHYADCDKAIEFTQTNGRVDFTIPKVNGHDMIVLDY